MRHFTAFEKRHSTVLGRILQLDPGGGGELPVENESILKYRQTKNTVTFNDGRDIKSLVHHLSSPRATLNETLTTKYNGVLPRTP